MASMHYFPQRQDARLAPAAQQHGLDAFAASIVHEVRQPLAAMMNTAAAFSQWVRRSQSG